MTLPSRDYRQDHRDPHWHDGHGPIPRIPPGFAAPPKKVGARIVWPRDKNRGTWGRLKDLMTGKGPDMYIGRNDRFAPTKATWSNWTEPQFDSLGYRDEHDFVRSEPRRSRYDFKSRRYVRNWRDSNVWSNCKWEPGKNPQVPVYHRDSCGNEYTRDGGFIPAPWQSSKARQYRDRANPYVYKQNTDFFDWDCPSKGFQKGFW